MKIVFNDASVKESLYPFGVIQPVSAIRVGILTIKEKWQLITGSTVLDSPLSSLDIEDSKTRKHDVHIGSNIILSKNGWQRLRSSFEDGGLDMSNIEDIKILEYPWQIFQFNDWAIRQDYDLLTTGSLSQAISPTNTIISPENIFIEGGAKVEYCTINASTGPVYIGKNAEVMEGCFIRGPFALCEGAVLKMGTKIYGATTIGPHCMAGGEIKNSVLMGYCNKAHDGYLGDSVIGEWCNLGAGTSNSNVKNTASTVKMWDNKTKNYVPVGLKAGLIMGDYSRAAINTSFNTGTTAGICCNIFGDGFPPKLISDFTWGKERYTFEKVLQDIDNWKKLKNQSITNEEITILRTLYNQ